MTTATSSHRETIELRPIEPGDEEFLFRVYASTRHEELEPVHWPSEQKEAFLRMQAVAQHRYYLENYATGDYSVILRGGVPAGRLYVLRGRSEIRLIDIALLPEHRGAGVGSALLGELLAEAARKRQPLTIHVEKLNPALRLYERLGFRPVADRGVYWFLEWQPPAAGTVADAAGAPEREAAGRVEHG